MTRFFRLQILQAFLLLLLVGVILLRVSSSPETGIELRDSATESVALETLTSDNSAPVQQKPALSSTIEKADVIVDDTKSVAPNSIPVPEPTETSSEFFRVEPTLDSAQQAREQQREVPNESAEQVTSVEDPKATSSSAPVESSIERAATAEEDAVAPLNEISAENPEAQADEAISGNPSVLDVEPTDSPSTRTITIFGVEVEVQDTEIGF